jgi:hypothetical protein
MDLAGVNTTRLLVRPEPHGAVGWDKRVDLTWPVRPSVAEDEGAKGERCDYFDAPSLGASGCRITFSAFVKSVALSQAALAVRTPQPFVLYRSRCTSLRATQTKRIS